MIESSGNTLRADSRCTLQERILSTIPKVFDPRQSKLHHKGSPWKGVRKLLRSAFIGSQAHTSRVLLAYNAEGYPILRKSMWQVPMLQQCHKITVWTIHPDERPMALRSMGTGHHGTLSDGDVTTQVPSYRDQLLHQMGRGRTTGNHHKE